MGSFSKREKAWIKKMVDSDLCNNRSNVSQVLHDIFVATPGYMTKRYYIGTSLQDAAVLAKEFKRRDIYNVYSDVLRRWNKNKLLKIERTANNVCIIFTEDGISELLKREISNCRDRYPDGMYTLVVFDIPEHVREIRGKWRRLLKSSGFIMLQQSVWVSNKRVSSELRSLIEHAKLEKWVSVFEAVEK
ncbi:CRISPR-associated endonuclease Cas2 [Candidatus Uhrbacteria bacterium]|nr:CRISPR-associated endonuclease Cas2 [Candidatus Uhrbacteria bacterium]